MAPHNRIHNFLFEYQEDAGLQFEVQKEPTTQLVLSKDVRATFMTSNDSQDRQSIDTGTVTCQ